jgi:hypothetical protein
MPTLGEHLAASFGCPEIAEQLRQLGPPLSVVRTAHQNLFLGMVLVAGAIAQRGQENFPSKAYWQYFRDHGVNPVLARPVGSLTISIGTRRAHESRQLGAVVEAFKFLARRNRQKRAIRSRAKVLLAAYDETSIVHQIFNEAGFSEGEFVSLLKVAVNGEPLERDRIREIATTVVPSLPKARGRRISPASAAHEEFLESIETLMGRRVGPRRYTYDNEAADFIDERTKATRLEFNDPEFDPRPACWRLAAHRKTRLSDGRRRRAD